MRHHPSPVLARASLAAALTFAALTLPPAAFAQGFPGGMNGGMDNGMGERNDRHRRRTMNQHYFEDMGSLGDALSHIHLTKLQKDTLARIEKSYRAQLAQDDKQMRDLFQRGRRPDPRTIGEIRGDAMQLQEVEFTAARAVLTPAQFQRFDANVNKLEQKQADQESRMREHFGRGERGGGGEGSEGGEGGGPG